MRAQIYLKRNTLPSLYAALTWMIQSNRIPHTGKTPRWDSRDYFPVTSESFEVEQHPMDKIAGLQGYLTMSSQTRWSIPPINDDRPANWIAQHIQGLSLSNKLTKAEPETEARIEPELQFCAGMPGLSGNIKEFVMLSNSRSVSCDSLQQGLSLSSEFFKDPSAQTTSNQGNNEDGGPRGDPRGGSKRWAKEW
ncbi:hypothetical protein GQR58_026731 [Nymphon striatum]|nr:hypothetical protein GQR58_026731 [Nymphon striatum]